MQCWLNIPFHCFRSVWCSNIDTNTYVWKYRCKQRFTNTDLARAGVLLRHWWINIPLPCFWSVTLIFLNFSYLLVKKNLPFTTNGQERVVQRAVIWKAVITINGRWLSQTLLTKRSSLVFSISVKFKYGYKYRNKYRWKYRYKYR